VFFPPKSFQDLSPKFQDLAQKFQDFDQSFQASFQAKNILKIFLFRLAKLSLKTFQDLPENFLALFRVNLNKNRLIQPNFSEILKSLKTTRYFFSTRDFLIFSLYI
jgi:hypothetical protein